MWSTDRSRHRLASLIILSRLIRDRTIRGIELLVVPLLLLGSIVLIGTVIVRSFTWTDMAGQVTDAKDRIGSENEIFRTLAQIFGGAFVLASLYFSAKSFAVARQSEVTERLSSALENLGSDSEARRTGGINSLAGLLRNPSADYPGIVRTLCDFVRTATKPKCYSDDFAEAPRADVQAAISALGSRRLAYGLGERNPLNLRGAFLAGADFRLGNFNGAGFDGAILTGALFHRAHLRKANFPHARVERANFNQADLRSTYFYEAQAKRATFRRAVLQNTVFVEADLTECSYDETVLKRVKFSSAVLTGVSWDRARLSRCNFVKVDPTQLDLRAASKVVRPSGLTEVRPSVG